MYRAPTARERERWHAVWLVSQGWSAARVAQSLGRDPHTIGAWLDAFRQHGPAGLAFEQTGGSPSRPDPGAASGTGRRRPPASDRVRDRGRHLELECGRLVCGNALRPAPEPQ